MEVAGQWRREWAGTAEYGKVTEGGVTRRVARALEVLHASGPGARVKVMRAAWHSTAGPGAPSSSYMVHSSRQVISSGSRLLNSPSIINSKPLEISSVPLDSSPDDNTDTENYKVTEPDDFDISEPTKWKSSRRRSSLRMPSEESSSTDNVSIIDLDSRNSTLKKNNPWRRHSCDSENSETQRLTSRASPLLEDPVTLSTLKYKSLLNNSKDSWDNRRKSYSFEDTSPLNDANMNSNAIAMESSTDSGICKSTEIVNDIIDENDEIHYEQTKSISTENNDESFKDWLTRNRKGNVYKSPDNKLRKDYDNLEDSRVSLQSAGKVSISLAKGPDLNSYKYQEDDFRRTKRVEFCKTELHFAAESGKVNIIATDEKPPPSNDFRKRRSAFVPIHSSFDKPVTLFGDKFDDLLVINGRNTTVNINHEIGEEENTAATKSILKNKIPKPKPYLLGENMDFGENDILRRDNWDTKSSLQTGVAIVNRQLEVEPKCVTQTAYQCSNISQNSREIIHKIERTIDKEKELNNTLDQIIEDRKAIAINNQEVDKGNTKNSFKNSLKKLQSSPIMQPKLKTRQLKESDLTYFGVNTNVTTDIDQKSKLNYKKQEIKSFDDMFHAVKLVKQVSHKTTRLYDEKDDSSTEYENIPIRLDFTPVPAPRARVKPEKQMHNNIITTESDDNDIGLNTDNFEYIRRSRVKRNDDASDKKTRSHSEPPKYRFTNHVHKMNVKESTINRNNKHDVIAEHSTYSPVTSLGEYTKGSEQSSKIIHPKTISDEDTKNTTLKNIKKRDKVPVYENMIINSNTSNAIKKHTKKDTSENITNNTVERKSRSRTSKKNDNFSSRPERNYKQIEHKIIKNEKSLKENMNNDITFTYDDNKGNGTDCSTGKSSKESKTNDRTKSRDKHGDHNVAHEKKRVKASNKTNADLNSQERLHSRNNDSNERDKKKFNEIPTHVASDKTILNIEKQKRSTNNKDQKEFDVKLDKRSKRNEYVLNYDDKNGTFSSISKIKPRTKSPDKTRLNSSRNKKKTHEQRKEANIGDRNPLRK